LHVEDHDEAENKRRRLYVYDPFPSMYLFSLGIYPPVVLYRIRSARTESAALHMITS
jgi:hypothetical protein